MLTTNNRTVSLDRLMPVGVMHTQKMIVDSNGRVCGHLETTLCHSEQELDECIRFSHFPGGFAPYRAQIPLPEIWPMAVLNHIEVYPACRKRGVASESLEQFIVESRECGAKLAFLRVGWDGRDSNAERAWRVAWYLRMGFIELQNNIPNLTVPFMYRQLRDEKERLTNHWSER